VWGEPVFSRLAILNSGRKALGTRLSSVFEGLEWLGMSLLAEVVRDLCQQGSWGFNDGSNFPL